MEVLLNLKVSSEEFFDFLIKSIVLDVNENSKKQVSEKDIVRGFYYTKNMQNKVGKKARVKILIRELELNKKYTAVFISGHGENIISYQVEELDDGSIDVAYSEEYIAEDKMSKWNFNIVNVFYKRRAKKKAIKLVKNIEAYIISNRGDNYINNKGFWWNSSKF